MANQLLECQPGLQRGYNESSARCVNQHINYAESPKSICCNKFAERASIALHCISSRINNQSTHVEIQIAVVDLPPWIFAGTIRVETHGSRVWRHAALLHQQSDFAPQDSFIGFRDVLRGTWQARYRYKLDLGNNLKASEVTNFSRVYTCSCYAGAIFRANVMHADNRWK